MGLERSRDNGEQGGRGASRVMSVGKLKPRRAILGELPSTALLGVPRELPDPAHALTSDQPQTSDEG